MASVLIIDDSLLTFAFAQSALQSHGHRVISARDGVEGLSTARDERPDVIITALSLPALDGLSVLRILREEGHTSPCIVIGDLQSDTTRTACEALGVVGNIPRPINAACVRELVDLALRTGDTRMQAAA